MAREITVAAIQTSYGEDMQANIDKTIGFIREAAAKGATPLVFARNGTALGVVAVADTLKPDASASVRDLRAMGLRVLLLTGDNERTARAVASACRPRPAR